MQYRQSPGTFLPCERKITITIPILRSLEAYRLCTTRESCLFKFRSMACKQRSATCCHDPRAARKTARHLVRQKKTTDHQHLHDRIIIAPPLHRPCHTDNAHLYPDKSILEPPSHQLVAATDFRAVHGALADIPRFGNPRNKARAAPPLWSRTSSSGGSESASRRRRRAAAARGEQVAGRLFASLSLSPPRSSSTRGPANPVTLYLSLHACINKKSHTIPRGTHRSLY